jgi:hypothetical protein
MPTLSLPQHFSFFTAGYAVEGLVGGWPTCLIYTLNFWLERVFEWEVCGVRASEVPSPSFIYR